MTPWPPQAMKGAMVKSSPERSKSPSPHRSRISSSRLIEPVASFTPTIARCCSSRRRVSGRRSVPVREGTLYAMTGSPTSAMAERWRKCPSCVGLL